LDQGSEHGSQEYVEIAGFAERPPEQAELAGKGCSLAFGELIPEQAKCSAKPPHTDPHLVDALDRIPALDRSLVRCDLPQALAEDDGEHLLERGRTREGGVPRSRAGRFVSEEMAEAAFRLAHRRGAQHQILRKPERYVMEGARRPSEQLELDLSDREPSASRPDSTEIDCELDRGAATTEPPGRASHPRFDAGRERSPPRGLLDGAAQSRIRNRGSEPTRRDAGGQRALAFVARNQAPPLDAARLHSEDAAASDAAHAQYQPAPPER
jgi:hypothetical protein